MMYDDSEIQTAAAREAALFKDFGARLSSCASQCPGLAAHLAGHELQGINSRDSLADLPVLRKNDLITAQQIKPPFGGFVREAALNGMRMFMSPGPVWEPQLQGTDPWQGAAALHAAGIRAGDKVHNAFSYHLTPGGFILDEAARALGCVVFPAGVGNTQAQVEAIRHTSASVYVGTPDYLQAMLDHAQSEGKPLEHIERALVSGGALFPSMRERYAEQGIKVMQCYATADLGVISYESCQGDDIVPGMVVNEGLIVEILVPGTATPVTPGEVGEIVVTRLHPDYPLLRFATGDLSRQITQTSPCGRTNMRLAGWMGRADQRVKVKGMFVDPLQFALMNKQHPELARWRLVVTRVDDRDVMTLKVTLAHAVQSASKGDSAGSVDALEATLKKATGLSGSAVIVDALPDDGIVVDDQRGTPV